MTIEARVTANCNGGRGLVTIRSAPASGGRDDIYISISPDETKVISVTMKREELGALLRELNDCAAVWKLYQPMMESLGGMNAQARIAQDLASTPLFDPSGRWAGDK